MILEKTDLVREVHTRGRGGNCFYCPAPVGSAHAPECVCLQRTVVVRLTLDLVSAEPRSHSNDLIEFALSAEGSYCADNTIARIGEWLDRQSSGCLCGAVVSAEVLREATQEDHDTLPLLFNPETAGE